MKYSLCLTNYNRYDMLIESFANVLDDPRIDEVIISDDASDNKTMRLLVEYFYDKRKIKLRLHDENVGMYLNKCRALAYAKNDMCILFDSDNILDTSYLDALDEVPIYDLPEKIILSPSFAKPKFDFRHFSGCQYNLSNIGELINDPMGNVLMNCCNYVINKKHFVKQHNPLLKACDSIWMNLILLKAGFSIYIVPGLEYFHRVHDDSGFLLDLEYNMTMSQQLRQMILMESEMFNKKNK